MLNANVRLYSICILKQNNDKYQALFSTCIIVHSSVKSVAPPTLLVYTFLRCVFLAIMCKHVVIRRTI